MGDEENGYRYGYNDDEIEEIIAQVRRKLGGQKDETLCILPKHSAVSVVMEQRDYIELLKAERDEAVASVAELVADFDKFYVGLSEHRPWMGASPVDLEGLPQKAKDHLELHEALLKEHDSTNEYRIWATRPINDITQRDAWLAVEAIKQRMGK